MIDHDRLKNEKINKFKSHESINNEMVVYITVVVISMLILPRMVGVVIEGCFLVNKPREM